MGMRLVAALLTGIAVLHSGVAAAQGPLLHYQFDGDALDSSGNGLHGALTGSPTYVPLGSGQAIHFDNPAGSVDATQYLSLPDLSMYSNDSLTIAIRFSTTDTSQNNGRLFGNHFTVPGLGIGYNRAATANAGILAYGAGGSVAFFDATAGPEGFVADGQWHWIALVLDRAAAEGRAYIDGASQVQSIAGIGSTPLADLRIGSSNDPESTGRAYGALQTNVDDFRIYAYALSPQQVAELVASPEPASGILAAWRVCGAAAIRRRAKR
jgi:hypothetical protein